MTHAEVSFCAGPADFLDPVQGGALIGIPGGEIGTLACMVADAAGQPLAVTAGHVVRKVPGAIGGGRLVQQPTTQPPGMPAGATLRCGRTIRGFLGNQVDGFRDFVLIKLDTRAGISEPLDEFPSSLAVLAEAAVVSSKLPVSKLGAATGRTFGVFSSQVPTITIEGMVANDVWEFVGVGTLFAQKGDSGALVVSAAPGSQGAIVGILFATAPPQVDSPGGRGFVFPFGRITGVRPA